MEKSISNINKILYEPLPIQDIVNIINEYLFWGWVDISSEHPAVISDFVYGGKFIGNHKIKCINCSGCCYCNKLGEYGDCPSAGCRYMISGIFTVFCKIQKESKIGRAHV